MERMPFCSPVTNTITQAITLSLIHILLPHTIQAIVTEMDCYAYLRPMAQLFEARCGGGVILVSSMGLQDLQQYPEARALLHSLYQYMDSESFAPQQELPPELFASLAP